MMAVKGGLFSKERVGKMKGSVLGGLHMLLFDSFEPIDKVAEGGLNSLEVITLW